MSTTGEPTALEAAPPSPGSPEPATESMEPPPLWRRMRWLPIAAFVVSRVLVTVVQLRAMPVLHNHKGLSNQLALRWDGGWYVRIASLGYTHHLLTPGGLDSTWGFFPLYPLVIRGVHEVTRLPYTDSALGINWVLDVVLAFLLWKLAAAVAGAKVADRASVLFWFAPGVAVLTMAYTEPLFLCLACGCLLALVRRRWWVAGLLAALGTGTRPDGVALVVACAVACLVELRRAPRQWSSLAAPVLSPLGGLAFLVYTRLRTGSWSTWLQAEKLWDQKFDFGRGTKQFVVHNLEHHTRFTHPAILVAIGLAMIIVAVLGSARHWHRIPLPLTAYVLVVLVLTLGDTHVGARPRFVLAMIPLFIITARWLRGPLLALTATGLGAALVWTSYIYLATLHATP